MERADSRAVGDVLRSNSDRSRRERCAAASAGDIRIEVSWKLAGWRVGRSCILKTEELLLSLIAIHPIFSKPVIAWNRLA
jgi:hypothetical protein